jgi:hypothetical protein
VSASENTAQSEERAARNEVLFREANEKLREKRLEVDADGLTPFLCECSNPACTEVLRLSMREYEYARSRPTWFITAVDHENEHNRIEQHPRYMIVEKAGTAGRIADEENPRE